MKPVLTVCGIEVGEMAEEAAADCRDEYAGSQARPWRAEGLREAAAIDPRSQLATGQSA